MVGAFFVLSVTACHYHLASMDTITIGKRSYEIPGSWDEIKPKQYERLALLLPSSGSRGRKDTTALRVAMIFSLLSHRKRITFRDDLKLVGLFDIAEDANRQQNLLKVVNWIFEQREVEAHTEIKPIIPHVKLQGTTYLLPKPNLMDVTIGEWLYIDALLKAYAKTRQKTHLTKLIAAVCRPAKPAREMKSEDFDGFPRVKFNPETIHHRTKVMQKAPIFLQHAVIDYCSRAAQWIPLRYPSMFKGGSSSGKSYGWEGTITELADSGAFGTEKEVQDVLIHKVCRYLCKKIETMKEASSSVGAGSTSLL